ncbi:MAG: dihydropteroate synthase [Actinomycetota bacterium]
MERLVWRVGDRVLDCGKRTLVMGVLNVTPDSFSDGGQFFDPETAVSRGIGMVAEGADLIDVGGESTRPGADPVSVDEERRRVLPVIKRLAAEVDAPISIDTRKADVAVAALEAGAAIVNDISAGRDPDMFAVARDAGAGVVLMHMRGEPATMQEFTDYVDVVAEVRDQLAVRVDEAREAGVDADRIVVDPGIGFAKTPDQNLTLLRDVRSFFELGRPVLVGPSRKSFIGKVLDVDVEERLEGTAAAVAWLVAEGTHIVRVHDVKEMVRVIRVVEAIKRGSA